MSSALYLPVNLSFKPSITSFPSLISATTIPSVVPQSWLLTITSWDTSTSLLVKYPESAVLRAVSALPFLAPWVDIKYSNTSRPSLNDALIGNSIILPEGFAISPLIPANCLIWDLDPLAPESAIIYIGLNLSILSISAFATSSVVSVHFWITLSYLSSSEINPLLNIFSILSTVLSVSSSNSYFLWGTIISEAAIVIAPIEE